MIAKKCQYSRVIVSFDHAWCSGLTEGRVHLPPVMIAHDDRNCFQLIATIVDTHADFHRIPYRWAAARAAVRSSLVPSNPLGTRQTKRARLLRSKYVRPPPRLVTVVQYRLAC